MPQSVNASKIQPPDARQLQCPLCGATFSEEEGMACQYCPKLFKSCGMAACPRCGHEFPRKGSRRR